MQLALIQFNKGGQANHLSGHLVAFAGHRGCEKAVQCFAFVVDVILRLHRFSRVVHREPSVPSNQIKGLTLYERRDKLRKTDHLGQTLGKLVAGSNIDASWLNT